MHKYPFESAGGFTKYYYEEYRCEHGGPKFSELPNVDELREAQSQIRKSLAVLRSFQQLYRRRYISAQTRLQQVQQEMAASRSSGTGSIAANGGGVISPEDEFANLIRRLALRGEDLKDGAAYYYTHAVVEAQNEAMTQAAGAAIGHGTFRAIDFVVDHGDDVARGIRRFGRRRTPHPNTLNHESPRLGTHNHWDGPTIGPGRRAPSRFGVDPATRAADEAAGVLVNGRYIKNPTAKSLNSLLTDSGKIGGKQMSGRYMYVIDDAGNITIGTRAGQRMPHPTLIGGANPQVRGAGIVDIRGGRIFSVDNASGHFKPGAGSLDAAREAFGKLPDSAFHRNFEGYLPYSR